MSLGSRSGVNWMRRTLQSTDRARALASIVLPTPGTSSMRRWPSASSTVSATRMTSLLPSMTVSIAVLMRFAPLVSSASDGGRPSSPPWPGVDAAPYGEVVTCQLSWVGFLVLTGACSPAFVRYVIVWRV